MPTIDFKGKQHVYAHHLTVPYRPLVSDEAKSAECGDALSHSREQRAESREQRAESREQRAESREQRAESREQRAESREQRAESQKIIISSTGTICTP